MRKLWVILLFLSSTAVAQHVPLQSQYMFNPVALNPAFTGSAEGLSAVGSYRSQWVGFEGAPTTQSITVHSPLKNQNSAVGLQFFADQIGVDRTIGLYGSYAYRLRFDNAKLSLGISGGINFMRAYYSRLNVNDNADQLLMADSPLGVLPEFSFGAHYYSEKYFLSFSIPMFLTHNFDGANYEVENSFSNYNYMLGGGYIFDVYNNTKLKPSVLAKYRPDGQLQADINLMALLNEAFDVGVSYRTKEAVVGMFEIRPNQQLGIMYSYGYPLSDIQMYTSGSHEISLKYTFKYKTKITGPRSLGW